MQNQKGVKGIISHIESLQSEFRAGMFLAGAKKVSELHGKKYYLFGKTKEWVEQL
jgi:isopentenyl diphosphate isomerase/L-lactate dehydrogenase-like FMN-dependent dehydrogenase